MTAYDGIRAGSRILADRRPAEIRDPRALDPRVSVPHWRDDLTTEQKV